MQTLWQDLRYGARMLLKKPGFTLIAVITLALGIGANTAIFSLINGVLLRELPYHEPDRVAVLWADNSRSLSGALEVPPANTDVAAWRERTQSFAHVAAFTPQTADLAEQGDPERVGDVAVTPEFFRAIGVEPFLGRTFTPEESRPAAASVGLLLLIACVNVANLLLARGVARQRELAIRAALGAGRVRVVRQLLTESVLLSLLGGGLGLLFAEWCIGLVLSLGPANLPRMENISLNATVFAFAALTSLITGVVFGLIPAFLMSKINLRDALNEGGRGTESPASHVLRDWLIAAEVALAVVLLVSAGLMVRSLLRVQAIDPGFKAASVLAFDVNLPESRYTGEQQQDAFFRQLLARLETLPGVRAAGAISFLPLGGGDNLGSFIVEGAPVASGQVLVTERRVVTPGYFAALGVTVRSGRTFTTEDRQNQSPVVVINETMARRFFDGENPVGKRLKLGRGGGSPWRAVVGVVRDVKSQSLEAETRPQIYLPLAQWSRNEMSVVLQVEGAPLALVSAARAETKALDPFLPLAKVRTMQQVVAAATGVRRFNMIMLALFAGTALLLTVVGLYGVITYLVGRRVREIGIRMALGAGRSHILRLILAQGMKPVVVGGAIGIIASIALTRLLKTLLFGVSATDPLTFAVIALLLTAVALLACWIPARRASKVDPMIALRCE